MPTLTPTLARRSRCIPARLPALVLACSLAHAAHASDLFVVTGTGTNVPTINVGGSSLIDLIDDAVNTQNQFAAFETVDSTFRLNYGGVSDAIIVTKNAGNTQATIQLLGQPTRTFTGVNQADLENQIEDYLKKQGSSDLTEFFKAVNQRSVIGVSDGNPNATTARFAQFTFDKFGFFADQFKAFTLSPAPQTDAAPALAQPASSTETSPRETGGPSDIGTADSAPQPSAVGGLVRSKAGVQFSLAASGSTFDVGNFSGESATISSSLDLNFSQRVGLSLGSFVAYNSVEDADVFHGAFVLGVPVRIVLPDGASTSGLTWQVTPHATVGGSASEDIGAGGLVFGFGATSYLAWHINERWTLAMTNQFSNYQGEKLKFDEYEIDPGVDQSMLKNGLRATYRFSEQWYAYAGAAYTNFLDDAAIEHWITGTAGVGYSTAAGTGVQLGIIVENGDDYEALGARLGLTLAF